MLALLSTGLRTAPAVRRRSLRVSQNPFSRQRSLLCHAPALAMDAGEMPPPPLPPSPPHRRKRPFCARCSKPASVCLCSRLRSPPLDNAIGVTILQHNLEGKHALNSARVASLGLRNVAVVPVTDVLFSAEYAVRPMRRGTAAAPLGGGGRSGEVGLGEISNATALRGGVPWVELQTDSLDGGGGDGDDDDDDDGDLHFPDGSCDRKWSRKGGTLQVPVARGEGKSNGFSANARCRSEDPLCNSENCKSWILISKAENGITSRDSTAPKRLIASPASDEETLDAQFQSKRSELCPDEESSGAEERNVVVDSTLYEVICSSSRLWFSLERTAKPDLSWVLGKPLGKTATSNGFVVRKLRRRQLKGSLELEEVEEFKLVIPPGSALLFPGKSSIALGAVNFEVKHLIVLDGTWDKAKRMYYENPWLQFLPHLKLESMAASLYSEVRHQPRPGCFSTIESIVFAMKALGNDMEGLDNLLDVFESMVGDQRRCKDEKFSKMSGS